MQTIGILTAMESEIEAIKEQESIERIENIAGMDFCVGTLCGKNVTVVQCGMGKVNAAIATQTLISNFNVEAVINVGCAGCIAEGLDIGDFVVADGVVQHDFDVCFGGFKYGEVPYTGKVEFPADKEISDLASKVIEKFLPHRKLRRGLICTGDQFISTAEQKKQIFSHFPEALCAEMEGGAVGHTAYLSKVPFVIIRSMSDKADGSGEFLKHFKEVTREGAEAVVELVKAM